MSEYELTSLIFDVHGDMYRVFEFWLSSTFAVLVARFLAGDRLSKPMLWLLAALYAGAAVRWAVLYIMLGDRTQVYRARLVESGFADIPRERGHIVTSELILYSLFLIGTIVTVHFCVRGPTAHGNGT
jgi:hypothetical protein